MRCSILFLLTSSAALAAQQPRTISGTLKLPGGDPVTGANIFILETLDGTISDSTGAFSFKTSAPAGATVVVQRLGLTEYRMSLGARDTLQIMMLPAVIALPEIRVVAGKFTTGSGPDAELTPIQVARTPGAAADVYRALQTFPGLQAVNEGAGLFVRGGDIAETRVYLNDALVLSPYRYESPTGGFFGAFDPFQLEGIVFSSGGFGARYGNALSGIAALRSLGKPERLSFGATASLASLSGTLAAPVSAQAGMRATLTRSHTDLMFRVNGSSTRFTQEPEGRDASVIAALKYGRGELRFFAIDQWSQLGVFIDTPSFDGGNDIRSVQASQILSWEHNAGSARLTLVGSRATSDNQMSFGAFALEASDRLLQLRALAELRLTPALGLNLGGELFGRRVGYTGHVSTGAHDDRPAAETRVLDQAMTDRHRAAFIETDWSLSDRLRTIVGVRTDHSRLTDQNTVDLRASTAFRITRNLTMTAAWGSYHQVPDPDLHDSDFGGADLGAMRAEHRIIGLQLGEQAGGGFLGRLEVYDKRYRDLAAFDRERLVHSGGTGWSHGLDLFLRWPSLAGFSGRTTFSVIKAERTDPNTGRTARSPFDITLVRTTVIERSIADVWGLSLATRHATGRPITPIMGASHDARTGVWVPVYGEPYSERLPDFKRVDLSLSRLVHFGAEHLLVLFAAINNIADRKNVHDYLYSPDYSERTPVRSQFKRSIYFGGTFSW